MDFQPVALKKSTVESAGGPIHKELIPLTWVSADNRMDRLDAWTANVDTRRSGALGLLDSAVYRRKRLEVLLHFWRKGVVETVAAGEERVTSTVFRVENVVETSDAWRVDLVTDVGVEDVDFGVRDIARAHALIVPYDVQLI